MPAVPDRDARLADAWWDEQSPDRKAQIHGWLTRPGEAGHPHVEGQIEIPLPPPDNTSRRRRRK